MHAASDGLNPSFIIRYGLFRSIVRVSNKNMSCAVDKKMEIHEFSIYEYFLLSLRKGFIDNFPEEKKNPRGASPKDFILIKKSKPFKTKHA